MLKSQIPVIDAENYAPIRPLLELEQKTEGKQDDFCNQIRSLYDELNSRDKELFESIAETAYTIASFMQGKQIFVQNWYRGGEWELAAPDKHTNPNRVRAFNKMQFQISQMLEDLVSSNPDFEPEDMFKSFEFDKAVKASKAVWNHYEKKFYTPDFNIQQGHSLITAGTAIEEICYDAGAKGVKVLREIWGEQDVTVFDGGGICFACGFQGAADAFYQWDDAASGKEFAEIAEAAIANDPQAAEMLEMMPYALLPQCSHCGSFETEVEQPIIEKFPSVISLEQYHLGDFRLNNLPIQAVRFDVTYRPEDSPYFIDKQEIPIAKIKHMFGRDVHISENAEDDRCLDYLHKMARIGASIGGARHDMGTKPRARTATLCRMSLSPEVAAEIDIPNGGDLKTVSGKSLKPGATLGDMFPEGCTILGFNRMETVIGVYGRHHSKTVSSAVYFSKPNAGTGRGAEDLTEIQKRWNRLDQQQVAAVDGASPGYAFVEGSIDQKHVKKLGFPSARVPVSRQVFMEVQDINKLVRQFEPQAVAPQFFAYAQELEKMMQMTAHNVSMSGSVFDADNKTATGARILEATAQAITIPMLQSKAGARKGTIRNLLCGYKEKFASATRKFSVGSNKNKHFAAIEVSGQDIDPNIEFVVVENSQIPQNFYLRKMDYMAFAQAVAQLAQGGYQELKATDPELLSILSKTFNVDIGDDDYDQITDICRVRMLNAFELAPMIDAAITQASAVEPMNDFAPAMAESAPMPKTGLTENPESLTMQAAGDVPMAPPETMMMDLLFASLDIPIRPKEKNHQAKIEWFRDFADTPEGLRLDPMQRQIVFEFILRHEEAVRIGGATDMAQDQLAMLAATGPVHALQAKGEQIAEMASAPPPEMMMDAAIAAGQNGEQAAQGPPT